MRRNDQLSYGLTAGSSGLRLLTVSTAPKTGHSVYVDTVVR